MIQILKIYVITMFSKYSNNVLIHYYSKNYLLIRHIQKYSNNMYNNYNFENILITYVTNIILKNN